MTAGRRLSVTVLTLSMVVGGTFSGLGCSSDLASGVTLEDLDPTAFFTQEFNSGSGDVPPDAGGHETSAQRHAQPMTVRRNLLDDGDGGERRHPPPVHDADAE